MIGITATTGGAAWVGRRTLFVLPVSRVAVALRAPDGHDELMLGESAGADVHLRVAVVRRLAPAADAADWETLPYVDVDAALLAVRRQLLRDTIVAEIQCRDCHAWGDIRLSIAAYLAAKRRPSRVALDRVRVPTVGQVLTAIAVHGDGAAAALEAECVTVAASGERRRALQQLERIAPPLAGTVEGVCPHCTGPVVAWFDPGAFVLGELRRRASRVIADVHLLASQYGWTEAAILDLPGLRRTAYAALAAVAAGER
jgi:hypothetical protein